MEVVPAHKLRESVAQSHKNASTLHVSHKQDPQAARICLADYTFGSSHNSPSLRFNNSLERLGEVRIAVIFVVCVCHKEGCRCGQQREELQTGGSRTQELECPAVLS